MADWFPTFRKLGWRTCVLFSLLLVVGAAGLWGLAQLDPRRKTVLVEGTPREYLWYPPPSSRSSELKPLVLAYHGFSGTAQRMADSSRLHELAAEQGFYLAYIEGNPTWHMVVPEGATASPDVAFFDRLCDELVNSHPIDPERIYVVGMSRGGDFAVYLAARRSRRIAAVVSQGACVPEAVDAERPFPLLIIAGEKDDRVPADRFPSVPAAFRERGHVVQVLRPENVGHRWHVPLNGAMWEFLSAHRLSADASGRSK